MRMRMILLVTVVFLLFGITPGVSETCDHLYCLGEHTHELTWFTEGRSPYVRRLCHCIHCQDVMAVYEPVCTQEELLAKVFQPFVTEEATDEQRACETHYYCCDTTEGENAVYDGERYCLVLYNCILCDHEVTALRDWRIGE